MPTPPEPNAAATATHGNEPGAVLSLRALNRATLERQLLLRRCALLESSAYIWVLRWGQPRATTPLQAQR